jgi:hypothetical protein
MVPTRQQIIDTLKILTVEKESDALGRKYSNRSLRTSVIRPVVKGQFKKRGRRYKI